MSNALPFTVKKRVVDPSARAFMKKPYCELSGRVGWTEVHHIKRRSQGGDDIPENLICLSWDVHRAVHDGRIDTYVLVQAVAAREGLAPEGVCERIGLPVPSEWPVWERPSEPTLEEVIQLLVDIQEELDGCKWREGELFAALVECGATMGWIAGQVRRSVAYVSERIKVWRTFYREEDRIPELTWEHHRVAVQAGEKTGISAGEWLARAAEAGWSTREFRDAVEQAVDPEGAVYREERERREAAKLYSSVESFLRRGGPAALWLKDKLKELVSEAVVGKPVLLGTAAKGTQGLAIQNRP